MTRSIISKFIIVLIILFTALSIFWFFKTSAIKKQAMAMIKSSGGSISAASVSVAGFPLNQKLSINDLKIQLALTNPLPNLPTNLIPNKKYQIQIKTLEASASIFSGDFAVNNILDVSFQDQNGATHSVQFNQPPKSNFLVSGGNLTKFSYQDSGYKIIDAGKNILFENGNSVVEFESALEGDKYRNKIKADFKDVGALSFGNDIANPAPEVVSDDTTKDANATTEALPAAQDAKPVSENQVAGSLVKKSLSLELEYIVAKPSLDLAPVPNPELQNTATSDIALENEKVVESLVIKNFEISSPLYKFNINGEITSFQKDALPVGSVSVRIEKLDNILIYIKKSFANLQSTNNPSKVDNIADAPVDNNPAVDVTMVSTSDSATDPASNQKPEADISLIIKDLSKKNIATNEDIAVFDFRQEQGKDLLINETSLSEIMSQIFVTNNSIPNAAEGSVVGVSPGSPSVGEAAAPATAPIPTPAKIETPAAQPKNAN